MASLQSWFNPKNPDGLVQVMRGHWRLFFAEGVLLLILGVAAVFAPLLAGWHDLPPLKSLFFSLVAALRNWRAFLIYALTLLAIIFIPVLLSQLAMQVSETFGQIMSKAVEILMLMLILPIILAGSYVSYRDIFATAPSPPTTPPPLPNE